MGKGGGLGGHELPLKPVQQSGSTIEEESQDKKPEEPKRSPGPEKDPILGPNSE